MLRLVKGVVADGVVLDSEAAILANWTPHHLDAIEQWQGSVFVFSGKFTVGTRNDG